MSDAGASVCGCVCVYDWYYLDIFCISLSKTELYGNKIFTFELCQLENVGIALYKFIPCVAAAACQSCLLCKVKCCCCCANVCNNFCSEAKETMCGLCEMCVCVFIIIIKCFVASSRILIFSTPSASVNVVCVCIYLFVCPPVCLSVWLCLTYNLHISFDVRQRQICNSNNGNLTLPACARFKFGFVFGEEKTFRTCAMQVFPGISKNYSKDSFVCDVDITLLPYDRWT